MLVVDDRPDVRLALTYMLEASGYQTLEASDGEQALQILKQGPVAVILTDLRMPGMGGRELAQRVSHQEGWHPRVIMMSGSEHITDADAAALGADAVLPKPFSREQLVNSIKAAHHR